MKRDRTSVDLCDHTSCLFQDYGGSRIIVWLKLKFQVNRIASRCCTTESQCCGTAAADRKTVLEHLFHHAEQPVYTGLIIKYNRVPTVRECARLQSFPDDFIFLGNKTQQFRQVGNAVPPLMAQAIAEKLKKELEDIYE